jgi:hypothetical protein
MNIRRTIPAAAKKVASVLAILNINPIKMGPIVWPVLSTILFNDINAARSFIGAIPTSKFWTLGIEIPCAKPANRITGMIKIK